MTQKFPYTEADIEKIASETGRKREDVYGTLMLTYHLSNGMFQKDSKPILSRQKESDIARRVE